MLRVWVNEQYHHLCHFNKGRIIANRDIILSHCEIVHYIDSTVMTIIRETSSLERRRGRNTKKTKWTI